LVMLRLKAQGFLQKFPLRGRLTLAILTHPPTPRP
jgi:hypothetical protein